MNVPIKVLFLLPNLDAGGAERVSISIARLLKKNGTKVLFVNFGNNHGEMESWIIPSFDMISLDCKSTFLALKQLRKVILDHPEYYLFSSREHTNLASIISTVGLNRNIIIRIPNMPYNRLEDKRSFKQYILNLLDKFILKKANIIIAQNEEMRLQAIESYNLTPSKIVTINNPVDVEFIKSQVDESINPFKTTGPNFLAVGKLAYAKGFDILIESFREVRKSIPDSSLYILGRKAGEYGEQFYEKFKNEPNVFFEGFQSNPYNYINKCDAFVLSSRMEGFPNVVLEAIALKKPVVSTTCVDVINEVIDVGKNGYYCDVNNVEQLAEKMIKVLNLYYIEVPYQMFNEGRLLEIFNIHDTTSEGR